MPCATISPTIKPDNEVIDAGNNSDMPEGFRQSLGNQALPGTSEASLSKRYCEKLAGQQQCACPTPVITITDTQTTATR